MKTERSTVDGFYVAHGIKTDDGASIKEGYKQRLRY